MRATQGIDRTPLRAPGWLDKPGALRSGDVCLDSRALSIDVCSVISVLN